MAREDGMSRCIWGRGRDMWKLSVCCLSADAKLRMPGTGMGRPRLWLAVGGGHGKVAHLLIKNGADAEAQVM